MTGILLATIACVAISVMVSPLLARVIAAAANPESYPFTDSLGGTNTQPAVEGRTRPVAAADVVPSGTALPGVSPVSSPPADSAQGGEAASPATACGYTMPIPGDASKLPTPHAGLGRS